MRLSGFQTKIIWLIGLTVLAIVAFSLESHGVNILSVVVLIFRVWCILFLLAWSYTLSDTLQEICALKYRVKYKRFDIEVKYLTFWWLFIPYWRPIKRNYHSYKAQNVFGAKWDDIYTTDVEYKDESEAIKAIEKHKAEINENRKDWFKMNKIKLTKVKYM